MSYFTIFSSESQDLCQEGSQHSRHLLGSQPGAHGFPEEPMDPKDLTIPVVRIYPFSSLRFHGVNWCSGGISMILLLLFWWNIYANISVWNSAGKNKIVGREFVWPFVDRLGTRLGLVPSELAISYIDMIVPLFCCFLFCWQWIHCIWVFLRFFWTVQYPIGMTASQEQVPKVHTEPTKKPEQESEQSRLLLRTHVLCIPCLSPVDLCVAISQMDCEVATCPKFVVAFNKTIIYIYINLYIDTISTVSHLFLPWKPLMMTFGMAWTPCWVSVSWSVGRQPLMWTSCPWRHSTAKRFSRHGWKHWEEPWLLCCWI